MNYYAVIFEGTPKKEYIYKTNLDLPLGATCQIVADGTTTYNNNVFVSRKLTSLEAHHIYAQIKTSFRVITSYKIIKGAPRQDDRIKNVYFNEEKGTTCVVWWDGQKTIVRCQPGDEWDPEKALALCYMKRVLGNRGAFNETLKKWVYNKK